MESSNKLHMAKESSERKPCLDMGQMYTTWDSGQDSLRYASLEGAGKLSKFRTVVFHL
jgi:hypothetical protein